MVFVACVWATITLGGKVAVRGILPCEGWVCIQELCIEHIHGAVEVTRQGFQTFVFSLTEQRGINGRAICQELGIGE
jgi:hypothetical protein